MALRVRYTETPTGNPFIDSLVSEYQFFDSAVPAGQAITITYRLAGTISWATDNAATALRGALDAWTEVVNVRFVETTATNATWTETLYSDPASSTLGSHYFPNGQNLGGEYNVGHSLSTSTNNQRGGIGFVTYLHELGHGLGLNHPFEDDPFPGVTPGDPYDRGDNNFNNGIYTVMAYDDDPWFAQAPGYSYGYAATPMAFDVAAAQAIYGANMTTRTGGDVYVLPTANAAGTFWTCIWDAGGNDTVRAAVGSNTACTIDLRAATLLNAEGGGGYVSRQGSIYGGFTIANGVIIENAIGGGGGDTINGNGVANRLEGLGGADSIYGYDGADILIGGAGADNLYGGAGADRFTYTLASDSSTSARDIVYDFVSGTDKIDLSALTVSSYTINTTGGIYLNALIGGVTLSIDIRSTNGFVASDIIGVTPPEIVGTDNADTLPGTSGDDRMRGLGGNDVITGLGGADTIDGGGGDDRITGGAGVDTLTGGTGADVFIYTAVSDSAPGSADMITDFVSGTDKIDLSALSVSDFEIIISDVVYVNALVGGATLSILVASANGFVASDLIGVPIVPQDLNLRGTEGIDDLQGGAGNDRLRGFGGNDYLYGYGGNDTLDGGTGGDWAYGGAGDDSYTVDSGDDFVIETAGNGHDIVYSNTAIFFLPDHVEDLILKDGAVDGYGNDLANSIIGNALGNRLYGLGGDDIVSGREGADLLDGGTGEDVMDGGAGDDLYIVDARRDKIGEAAGGGIDSVESSASTYVLRAHVENLLLTGAGVGGYGNDDANRLTGNALDNFLSGNGGDDIIDGGDGYDIIWGDAGTDTLTGGGGNDLFRYRANHFGGLTAETAERITDFDGSEGDRLDLRLVDAVYGDADDIFTFIGAGAFTGVAGQLRYAVAADHLLVLGDRDGNGVADLAVRLDGLTMLEASAVLL